MSIRLFFSYSHSDEVFKDKLITHFAALKRLGIIYEWHDRKISPGEEFDKTIRQELKESNIILLLVSSDFINSNYIYNVEIKHALERHEQNDAVVIPIILRPCDWKELNFKKLLALPEDGNPVTKWDNEDEAYLNIVEGIKRAINKFSKSNFETNVSTDSRKIYMPKNSILIRLPRGYVTLSSLGYQKNDGWSITAHYEYYDQSWGGGTHYHRSYRRNWEKDEYREIQFRKLQIPIADHGYAWSILDLIMDLRDRDEGVPISEVLKNYYYMEAPVEFFENEHELNIDSVSIPEKFRWHNKTGELRDLSKEFSYFTYKNYSMETLIERFDSKRRQTYLALYELLPPDHPALQFVKEVVDEFDKKMNIKELEKWSESMNSVISDTLAIIK
jgi:hypothetical protein